MAPVSNEALAGEHTGDTQKKLSKRIPDWANRSKLGVRISSLPEHPIAHAPWSSDKIKMIFKRPDITLPPLPIRNRRLHANILREFPVETDISPLLSHLYQRPVPDGHRA
jgi:hypothetical protein